MVINDKGGEYAITYTVSRFLHFTSVTLLTLSRLQKGKNACCDPQKNHKNNVKRNCLKSQ